MRMCITSRDTMQLPLQCRLAMRLLPFMLYLHPGVHEQAIAKTEGCLACDLNQPACSAQELAPVGALVEDRAPACRL